MTDQKTRLPAPDFPPVPKDDPLFSGGFVIGIRRSGCSFTSGAEKASEGKKPKTSERRKEESQLRKRR